MPEKQITKRAAGETDEDVRALHYTISELRNQLKKQKFFYFLSALSEQHTCSVHEMLQDVVERIPGALRQPDLCGARIITDDREFRTQDFSAAHVTQSESIPVGSKILGELEVCCNAQDIDMIDHQFADSEREFICTIAEKLGQIIDRKHGEALQLFLYHRHLCQEEALRESETKYATVVEHAGDGIVIILDGVYRFVNSAMKAISGFAIEELLGMPFEDIFPSEQREYIQQYYTMTMAEKDSHHIHESIVRRKDGEKRHIEIVFSPIKYHGRRALMGFFRDVTERKEAEATIRRLAYHDALTGLPNRIQFNERFEGAKARIGGKNKRMSIMLLDLDRFKEVNDTLGHTVGDQLLQAVAVRLLSLINEKDVVARMGGDEFMLLLGEIDHGGNAAQVAENIVEAFRSPFICDGCELNITTSVGIAMYPEDGTDIETLLKNADIAMYQAKNTGRNSFRLFSAKGL